MNIRSIYSNILRFSIPLVVNYYFLCGNPDFAFVSLLLIFLKCCHIVFVSFELITVFENVFALLFLLNP